MYTNRIMYFSVRLFVQLWPNYILTRHRINSSRPRKLLAKKKLMLVLKVLRIETLNLDQISYVYCLLQHFFDKEIYTILFFRHSLPLSCHQLRLRLLHKLFKGADWTNLFPKISLVLVRILFMNKYLNRELFRLAP